MLRLLSGCRHARAESAVGSAAMRWLRRADLGTDEIAYRTAQNLYSLHRSRRFRTVRLTDPYGVYFAAQSSCPLPLTANSGHPLQAIPCVSGRTDAADFKTYLQHRLQVCQASVLQRPLALPPAKGGRHAPV